MRLFTPTPTTLATPTDVVFQYDDVDNKGALERERERGRDRSGGGGAAFDVEFVRFHILLLVIWLIYNTLLKFTFY